MNPSLIVGIATVAITLLVLAWSTIRLPDQHAYVVERLGRYDQTLAPGFHVIVPFIDTVRHQHSLAEQTITVPDDTCRTRDDRQVWIDSLVTARVADARKPTATSPVRQSPPTSAPPSMPGASA